MAKLAPSILSADFSKLAEQVNEIETAGAHLVHVDVMDGHFVPNITFGAPVMKSLLGKTDIPFDVHLMIENPDMYIADFVTGNTEYITVHQEACIHLHRTLQNVKAHGVKAGVAINPATPLCMIEEVLSDVDLVLVMSVNPGFGGQKFIPSALEKIKRLDKIRKEQNLDFVIEIDGGAGENNIDEIIAAGTDIVVAGSSVFKADDIKKQVKILTRNM